MKLMALAAVAPLILNAPVVRGGPTEEIDRLAAKARQGNDRAALELAVRYRDGRGVDKDPAQALTYARLAADHGDADALDFVGYMYFRGIGVPRNADIAFGYFHAAAGRSAQGGFNLGQCYFGAQGCDLDPHKALQAWKHAADLGSGVAAVEAAMMELEGEGVARDPAEARRLAARSAELGNPGGHVLLGEIKFEAGDIDGARADWQSAAAHGKPAATGQPVQPSDAMSAQQGADLIHLIDYRQRKNDPGIFALIDSPHVHQGYNNCGATACTMLARFQGAKVGAWDYKRLCQSPPGTGTDWGELIDASGKIGLHWKLHTFTPDDAGFNEGTKFLRSQLDAGRPIVIDFKFIGPQYPGGEAGHTLMVAGYIAAEKLFILRNPAIVTPGLELITEDDLKRYWRSDHYGALSHGVLSRPAIAIDP